VDTVQGIDGVNYPIKSCLVPTPHRPHGGWKLKFQINGQGATVDGPSAKSAVMQAESLFRLNEIPYSLLDLWFNANIQWIERAVDRYQRVKVADLLLLADAHSPQPKGNHEKALYPTEDWSAQAFNFLGLYLATSEYSYSKFLQMVEEIQSWMNPSENSLMGSSGYYIKITLRCADLRKIPLYKQDEARNWLVETLTYLGISNDTYDDTAKLYHWN